MAIEIRQVIELVFAILLPPVAVFLHANDCNVHLLISIVLCILFYLPAIIHAIWYCFYNNQGTLLPS